MTSALAPEALQSTGFPLHFGHCPGHLLMLGYFPYFVKQWLPYLQQKSCEWGHFGPGQSDHCGSWGGQEYSCPSALSHDPYAWDYLEHWQGECPVFALFRVAINLAIWSPSSFEPSDTSVAADDCALTFSFAFSVLVSAFLTATISWECMVLGLLSRYLIDSLIFLCTPWNSLSLRWHTTLWSAILPGHFSQI